METKYSFRTVLATLTVGLLGGAALITPYIDRKAGERGILEGQRRTRIEAVQPLDSFSSITTNPIAFQLANGEVRTFVYDKQTGTYLDSNQATQEELLECDYQRRTASRNLSTQFENKRKNILEGHSNLTAKAESVFGGEQ